MTHVTDSKNRACSDKTPRFSAHLQMGCWAHCGKLPLADHCWKYLSILATLDCAPYQRGVVNLPHCRGVANVVPSSRCCDRFYQEGGGSPTYRPLSRCPQILELTRYSEADRWLSEVPQGVPQTCATTRYSFSRGYCRRGRPSGGLAHRGSWPTKARGTRAGPAGAPEGGLPTGGPP